MPLGLKALSCELDCLSDGNNELSQSADECIADGKYMEVEGDLACDLEKE